MSDINAGNAASLKNLETVLVSDHMSVKSALEIAFMMGYHQGCAEMADKALKDLLDLKERLLPKVPA